MKGKFKKRNNRKGHFDYNSPGSYFITFRTNEWKPVLSSLSNGKIVLTPAGKIVETCWHRIPERYPPTQIDAFVIMPDHFHGILRIPDIHGNHCFEDVRINQCISNMLTREYRKSIGVYYPLQRRRMMISKIIGWFKHQTAKELNNLHDTPGQSLWDKDFHDHIIRSDNQLRIMREYIELNPSKRSRKS